MPGTTFDGPNAACSTSRSNSSPGPSHSKNRPLAQMQTIDHVTVSVTQGQLFTDNDAPWNAMMAAAIIYVLPPLAILFALRRYVAASLTTVSSGV